jgi:hypothetical protein
MREEEEEGMTEEEWEAARVEPAAEPEEEPSHPETGPDEGGGDGAQA